MFLGITPVRISFAGGGTDIPEYYEQFGGHVITTCISRFVYVFLNERQDKSFQAFSPDFQYHQKPISYEELKPKNGTEIAVSVLKYLDYKQGVDIFISSDVPPGSGLGASGALAVNLVNTISSLKGQELSHEEVSEMAYHVGRNILNWPIGKQDEYATSFGGFNYIKFEKEKTTVEPINMNS